MKVEFTISGKPCGKGRPRHTKSGHTYTPEATVNFETLTKLAYQQAGGGMHEGAISLTIYAYYSIPQSASKKKQTAMLEGHEMPMIKPDVDNVAKIIMDALNQIAYSDDKQVVDLRVLKAYSAEPRTKVVVEEAGKC